MSMTTQAKLLRVLETHHVFRIGCLRSIHVDVRFIAATNRDPHALIREHRFRADLYFRLNGITVTIPPLRERKSEIAALAVAFARHAAATFGRPQVRITDDALARLARYEWPGNVRELKHVIERGVLFCSTDELGVAELEMFEPRLREDARAPADAEAAVGAESARSSAVADELHTLGTHMRTLQKQRILDALARAGGNQTRAAKLLGISRFQLMRRLADHGLERPRKRSAPMLP
jgi:DNA-binding NtrC family response regulator